MVERPRKDVSDGISWWCSVRGGNPSGMAASFQVLFDPPEMADCNSLVGQTVSCRGYGHRSQDREGNCM